MNEIKNLIKPKKLSRDSHIRIIAPSRSMGILSETLIHEATKRLESFGFTISFGKHVYEKDSFNSSSVPSRIQDLHHAFADSTVDAIFSVIGGYNANQLLEYIDYNLIANNPKILCGFSDITVLANAITSKTGMITYIGPHFSSWAMLYGFEYSLDYFIKCCINNGSYDLLPSKEWSDDSWYVNQHNRDFIKNDGYWVLNEGYAFGRLVGGHMRCVNALQGTGYWLNLDDSILVIEEDSEVNLPLFDRQLQSLIHQPDFSGVKGILIGRFQKAANITKQDINKVIASKQALENIPIIANIDFGHTTPILTLPIGGSLELLAKASETRLRIIEH
jgi:muramoyltetrapeptide carboxypeptidase